MTADLCYEILFADREVFNGRLGGLFVKRDIFLIIIISYIAFLSVDLNAAQENSNALDKILAIDPYNANDHRHLNFEKACDKYITRKALFAASLGSITSAAYCYYKDQSINPFTFVKIAAATGLSYAAGKKYAQRQVEGNDIKELGKKYASLNNNLAFFAREVLVLKTNPDSNITNLTILRNFNDSKKNDCAYISSNLKNHLYTHMTSDQQSNEQNLFILNDLEFKDTIADNLLLPDIYVIEKRKDEAKKNALINSSSENQGSSKPWAFIIDPLEAYNIRSNYKNDNKNRARWAAIQTGIAITGLGASFFYFRPELKTFRNLIISAFATLGISGLRYQLKKTSLDEELNEISIELSESIHKNNLDLIALKEGLCHDHAFDVADLPTIENYWNNQNMVGIYEILSKDSKATTADDFMKSILGKAQDIKDMIDKINGQSNQNGHGFYLNAPNEQRKKLILKDFGNFNHIINNIDDNIKSINDFAKTLTNINSHIQQSPEYKAINERTELIKIDKSIKKWFKQKIQENQKKQSQNPDGAESSESGKDEGK